MDFQYKITLFTPTFNRAYILEKLYRSIQRQTYRDFEWLILDDGSTDNTEELVRGWMGERNDFPIRYYKVANGGKCRAINRGLNFARGELFFVVDSDDQLTKDALEKLSIWESSLSDRELFCGVSGNMGTSETFTTNSPVQGRYYDGNMLDRYSGITGERAFAIYTELHRKYLFPTFDGENFMTEAVVWNRMAADGYRVRFFNDIICIYEYRDDGLTKAGNRLFLNNPRGYALWLREKNQFLDAGIRARFLLWYSYYCEMTFCEPEYCLTKRQIAEYIGAPLAAIYAAAFLHAVKTAVKDN